MQRRQFLKTTHIYGSPETRKGPLDLLVDVYRPVDKFGKYPLVTWAHAGGFRAGSRTKSKHTLIAKEFLKYGYACAFIDYRLARPVPKLERETLLLLPHLKADAEAHNEEMHRSLIEEKPMAVIEDICNFYKWVNGYKDKFNLSGEHIMGGSSAGAISVLNALMLHSHLSLNLPAIRTAFVISGGFAYPSYWRNNETRILAISNPADPIVPISSIRRVSSLSDENFTLLESSEQEHGSIIMSTNEDRETAVGRLVNFDKELF